MQKDQNSSSKAIFLDRDGVINELVYYPEHGVVDSPFTSEQFMLIPGIDVPLKRFKELGYKLILVSNQPGMAKGHFTKEAFEKIRKKMNKELGKLGVDLDGEYYCFHHPQGKITEYKLNCDCRKPKPGLIKRATEDHNISTNLSVLIGDGLTDVKAGKEAGCRATILIGSVNSLLTKLMNDMGAEPDFSVRRLEDVVPIVMNLQRGGVPV